VFDATGTDLAVWAVATGASVAAAVACLPIDERPLGPAPAVPRTT
jgi:hypothetical protein